MRIIFRIIAPIALLGVLAYATLEDLRMRHDEGKVAVDSSILEMATMMQAATTAKVAFAKWQSLVMMDPVANEAAIARERRTADANLDLVIAMSAGETAEAAMMLKSDMARWADGEVQPRMIERAFSLLLASAVRESELQNQMVSDDVKQLLDESLFVIAAATGVAVLLYTWLGLSITVPLRRLMHAAEAIADGRKPVRFRATESQSEIGRLTSTFNRMSRALNTERERLETLAYFDQETRLPNRSGFVAEVDAAISSRSPHTTHQLVLLHVPRLAMMEGLFGAGYGRLAEIAVKDQLVQAVAEEVQSASDRPCATGDAIIGRLRFEVFGIFTPWADPGLADRLRAVFRNPAQVAERLIRFEASGAVAQMPLEDQSARGLLDAAEIALQLAEQTGPSVIFRSEMRERVIREREFEGKLRAALQAGEIEAHFQPKICCRSGRIAGFEALSRWRNPDGSYTSPGVFVPVAERTGIISQLDYAVMRQAIRFAGRMRAQGHDIIAAANISAATLEDPALVDTVGEALDKADLSARHLELEVTETTAITDMARALRPLQHLRDSGVRLALDDFGTGYSSLASLKQLPIHTLKLDRSFLPKDADDAGAIAISEAVLALARSLHLQTVGEGVETEWQFDFIRSRGCSIAQGFLHGKPMPADAFETTLNAARERLVGTGSA